MEELHTFPIPPYPLGCLKPSFEFRFFPVTSTIYDEIV
jgi:hypothetical protein